MASAGSVLEKKEKRQFMDDYIPLRVVALTSRILPSYVEYVVRVQRGPNLEERWDVVHRYSEFSALHEFLETSGITLPIPPKKMFGSKDKEVIGERQKGLQAFLDTVLCEPLLANTWEVKRFLDPTTYSDEPHEAALRNVSMVFRSHPEWTVTEPVRNIGWRFRKHYYLVANRREEKIRYFLTWFEPGPDFALNDKDLETALKLLSGIKHQFILSPVSAIYNGVGVAVMRQFSSRGSLHDVIYNCRPQNHVLKKYGVPCKWRILGVPDVVKYSRQILEGLKFLLDKGFVPAQVHAGNVIIEGGPTASIARISDIENTLLGLPSYYHHYLYSYELRKVQTMEAVLSYSFGQLLYEMAMCRPLNASVMENVPGDMPAVLRPTVESLLSKDAVKKPLPTVNDLIENEVFATVAIDEREKQLKVPNRFKEELLKCKSMMESRLQAQQKKVQQQKRLDKAKDAILSEEEKKKRRKLQKKQMSLQTDTSYVSYPTTEIRTDRPPPKSTAPAPKRSSKSHLTKQASASQIPTTTSTAAVPKPPPPPAAVAPPPPPVVSAPLPKTSSERGALLGSIHTFSKTALKKTVTNDRSGPKV
ncbi:PX domain-containing protein kinase-like protein [Dysidea avara]|uniref:PX domain-containing protein kinase-like protein n=1 Tax=Dysidea avara TaxID=196820 RepID=UPI0033345E13